MKNTLGWLVPMVGLAALPIADMLADGHLMRIALLIAIPIGAVCVSRGPDVEDELLTAFLLFGVIGPIGCGRDRSASTRRSTT